MSVAATNSIGEQETQFEAGILAWAPALFFCPLLNGSVSVDAVITTIALNSSMAHDFGRKIIDFLNSSKPLLSKSQQKIQGRL